MLIISIGFSLNGVYASRYTKYRFGKYIFDQNAVSNLFGSEKRTIQLGLEFYASIIPMLHGRRYSDVEEKFIVLWEKGVRPPVDSISPYVALRKYAIILLPHEEYILDMIRKSLGVDVIPEYPNCELYPNPKNSDEDVEIEYNELLFRVFDDG